MFDKFIAANFKLLFINDHTAGMSGLRPFWYGNLCLAPPKDESEMRDMDVKTAFDKMLRYESGLGLQWAGKYFTFGIYWNWLYKC